MASKKKKVTSKSNESIVDADEMLESSNDDFSKLLGKVLSDVKSNAFADAINSESMEFLPTKFTGLNRIAGIGGINVTGIWLLHGPTHSGKSALAKIIARTFLEDGNMVFNYNYEKADKDELWTNTLLGGEFKSLYSERKPMDFEEGANEMVSLMKKFHESRKALREKLKKLRKDQVKERDEVNKLLGKKICFIIDTVAKMVPRDEREGQIGKKNFGLLAALATQFMRVATSYIGETDSNMTLILVQHERQNQKAVTQFDPKWVLGPGGESINNFDPDVKLRVTHSVIKEEKVEVGKECNIRVYKCKIGVSGQECTFFIGNGKGKLPYGFDFEREVLTEAVNREDSEIVTKDGSKYYYDGELIANGFDNAVEFLRENPDTCEEIAKELNEEVINIRKRGD